MCAALGLLAKIISGTGGQVDVSLRDVMLSQLNYHASAYLNNGVEPTRRQYGAHSYYVPAQLFPTADGYLALFITHDGFWKSFAAEAGIHGFEQMAERVARRDEVLAVVTATLGTDTAASWEARLRPLGCPRQRCGHCRKRCRPHRKSSSTQAISASSATRSGSTGTSRTTARRRLAVD